MERGYLFRRCVELSGSAGVIGAACPPPDGASVSQVPPQPRRAAPTTPPPPVKRRDRETFVISGSGEGQAGLLGWEYPVLGMAALPMLGNGSSELGESIASPCLNSWGLQAWRRESLAKELGPVLGSGPQGQEAWGSPVGCPNITCTFCSQVAAPQYPLGVVLHPVARQSAAPLWTHCTLAPALLP